MPKKSVLRSIDKDILRDLILNEKSFYAVLKKLDLPTKGGIIASLKRILTEYEIDFSHIKLGLSTNKGKTFEDVVNPRKKNVEFYLTENSKVSRTTIKGRLIKSSLLKNQCYECNLTPEWNGKKLVLVLDHINGIHNDYRIENLRLLCPNCNSQTDTFSGRNKKYKNTTE